VLFRSGDMHSDESLHLCDVWTLVRFDYRLYH
jgi:hypothetical protein